jgi:hypothetical protein
MLIFIEYFSDMLKDVDSINFLNAFDLSNITSKHLPYVSEWSEGQVTECLVATFGDYFTDVKM